MEGFFGRGHDGYVGREEHIVSNFQFPLSYSVLFISIFLLPKNQNEL